MHSVFVIMILLSLFYMLYQRFLHPLSRYPGPLLASLTDLYKVYLLCTGRLPALLLQLHEKHGDVIRIGPNELTFRDAAALVDIYKAGRAMEKGPMYDGFTTFKPNVFGLRDENTHALRRRQMAHSFSVTALRTMEATFDEHIANLRTRLDQGGEADLKQLMTNYQYDLMGDLAFDNSFNAQLAHTQVPDWNDHFLLGCLYGMLPYLLPWSMKIGNHIPLSWFRDLVKSRQIMRDQTIACVTRSLHVSEQKGNRSLLSYVIEARDPVTGEKLSMVDICTEAFGFLVAGSHTTSSTITLLFSHLLEYPTVLQKVLKELAAVPLDSTSYDFAGVDKKLPYLAACINENFRMAAVTSIPLQRRVTAREGLLVSGNHLPYGTLVSVVSNSLHHNPKVFGKDHMTFNPDRWLGDNSPDPKLLFHFGNGHRQCMGRNLAMMSIWKVTTTLLKCYHLELVDSAEKVQYESMGLTERKGPLLVRVSRRSD